ncbi:hypothetical protein BDW59DRAFT_143186 [Aspergillus cavernicola]|uniref:Secreted protein n=1 Tax=Aspergillus cavernicola TaxID=176166 RepID=A0ABR4IL31_9EURO
MYFFFLQCFAQAPFLFCPRHILSQIDMCSFLISACILFIMRLMAFKFFLATNPREKGRLFFDFVYFRFCTMNSDNALKL